MREIFFHEDDYRQIELLPLDNLDFCKSEIAQINEFSEQHRDGMGWNDIHIRNENRSELVTIELSFRELDEKLQKYLPKFDKVFTGYSSERIPCDSTLAYGSEETGAMFIEVSDQGFISTIWFSKTMQNLPKVLISRNLLYVDWAWGFVCSVEKTEKYELYAVNKAETIRERMEHWQREDGRKKLWWRFW